MGQQQNKNPNQQGGKNIPGQQQPTLKNPAQGGQGGKPNQGGWNQQPGAGTQRPGTDDTRGGKGQF